MMSSISAILAAPGRAVGLAFITTLAAGALGFTALMIAGTVMEGGADDIGLVRVMCLAGIRVGEADCPNIENAGARAREEIARERARASEAIEADRSALDDEITSRRAEVEAELRAREAELAEVEAALVVASGQLEHLQALHELTDTFTLFHTANLGPLGRYQVISGTRYASLLDGSDPSGTYCYVTRDRGPITERLDIARNGEALQITDAQAGEMGLSAVDVGNAHALCEYAIAGS